MSIPRAGVAQSLSAAAVIGCGLVCCLVGCEVRTPPDKGGRGAGSGVAGTETGGAPDVASGAIRRAAPQDEKGLARRILEVAEVRGGLVVHVGCGDGKLTSALRANESYLVHGLDTDVGNIERARAHIREVGDYGKVSADAFDGERLPYIDNLVNLIVLSGKVQMSEGELERALAPRGVALVLEAGAGIAPRGTLSVSRAAHGWTKLVKPVPAETDEWTHFLHGADGNAVARDTVVGSPFHAQWLSGPKFTKTHSVLSAVNVMVSSGGRVFYIADEGPVALAGFLPSKWALVARDAFSGVALWRRALGPWQPFNNRARRMFPVDLHRRLVAGKDRVYATLSVFGPTAALDAATGETVTTYEGTELTQEIILDGETLLLMLGKTRAEEVDRRQLADQRLAVEKKRIMAFRAGTGEILWAKDDDDTVGAQPLTLAAGGGRVFFQNESATICLASGTGKELWRYSRPSQYLRPGCSAPTLVALGEVVLVADRDPDEKHKASTAAEGKVVALSVETGKEVWSSKCADGDSSPVDVFHAAGLVWIGEQFRRKEPDYAHGRDVRTGAVKRTFDLSEKWPDFHHHRCYRDKATERYILAGRTGVEFVDLATGKLIPHHWIRGNCKHGILPCNGLLYVPPHQCACFIEGKLNGLWALAPARAEAEGGGGEADRLEKGEAYGAVAEAAHRAGEWWPTYRHDPARSGHTKTSVPTRLGKSWEARLGGRITQPVAAKGRLFVASADHHTVHALDAGSGKRLWSHTAGGRVDSPPTVAGGTAVFGSADGHVYAVRASDGALVWRYRASPDDRRMVAHDQVESAWPVHGSVLVEGGVVYCAAGRSSYLDGGMYLCKLDLATGGTILEKSYFSRDPGTGETVPIYKVQTGTTLGADRELPGLLPDILSSDAQNIYMRHAVMSRDLELRDGYETHLFSSLGFLDDNWWERSYWVYGKHFFSNCVLWPYADLVAPGGRILAFDGEHVYGYKEPRTKVKARVTRPEEGKVFSVDQRPKLLTEAQVAGSLPRSERKKALRKVRRYSYRWEGRVPLVVRAMVLTDGHVFTAGPRAFDLKKTATYLATNRTDCADVPDFVTDASDAYAGGRGGVLVALDKSDGKVVSRCRLDSVPVFDGMIAADGKIFVSMVDGSVVCYAGD